MKLPEGNPDAFFLGNDGVWRYKKPNPKRQIGYMIQTAFVGTCKNCGEEFASYSRPKNKPQEFCTQSCKNKFLASTRTFYFKSEKGEKAHRWKGGRIERRGYILVYAPDHHSIAGRGTKRKYVLEHRIVMEKKLGRPLESHERVHHKDGDKKNNDPSNLELWQFGHPTGQRKQEQRHCQTCTCNQPEFDPFFL